MAQIKINYTPGGDNQTADENLIFRIYDDGSLIDTTGSATNDPNVTLDGSDIEITLNLSDATSYLISVAEVDEAGNEGPRSNEINITTSDPSDLLPRVYNFRIYNGFPNRVYFDSTGDVSGMATTGFFIPDPSDNSNNVSGISINGSNFSGHYLTLGSNMTWWDNLTVRMESGDGTIHDFYQTYVVNFITEPSAGTIRYATASGAGSHNGLNEANAWSYSEAAQNATSGMTVYLKAGSSSSGMNIANSGTSNSPIKFIGYKTTPGDAIEMPRSIGMSFDSAEMPMISGFSGHGINCEDESYIIIKNIQIQNGSSLESSAVFLDGKASYVHLENYYIDGNGLNFGVRAKDEKWNRNLRSSRAYIANCEQQGLTFAAKYNLVSDNWACTSYDADMDYYISINGGEVAGDGNNIVRDCYVYRDENESQVGHGISIKVGHKYSGGVLIEEKFLTRNLIENNEVWNCAQSYEAKHYNCSYSVYRNNKSDDDTGTNHAGGIMITNGAHHNVFINMKCFDGDYGIQFTASSEDRDAPDAGNNNLFINCIFLRNDYGIFLRDDNFASRKSYGNKAIHCSFDQSGHLIDNDSNDQVSGDNEFINSLILDSSDDYTGGNETGWDFSYCCFDGNSSFSVPSGDGNFEEDPLLDSNYVPQANFSDIDVPVNALVKYDFEDKERATTLTTVGPKISNSE